MRLPLTILFLLAWVIGFAQIQQQTDIFFDSDSSILTEANKEKIKNFTNDEWYYLIIRGHTDNTNNISHNLFLAKARATSVYQFLSDSKKDMSKISVNYSGSLEPKFPNLSGYYKSQNRRVELIKLPKQISTSKDDDYFKYLKYLEEINDSLKKIAGRKDKNDWFSFFVAMIGTIIGGLGTYLVQRHFNNKEAQKNLIDRLKNNIIDLQKQLRIIDSMYVVLAREVAHVNLYDYRWSTAKNVDKKEDYNRQYQIAQKNKSDTEIQLHSELSKFKGLIEEFGVIYQKDFNAKEQVDKIDQLKNNKDFFLPKDSNEYYIIKPDSEITNLADEEKNKIKEYYAGNVQILQSIISFLNVKLKDYNREKDIL